MLMRKIISCARNCEEQKGGHPRPSWATPRPQLGVRLTTGPASAARAAASRRTSEDSAPRRPQGLRHCGTTGTTGGSESRMAVPKLSSAGSMVQVLMQAEPARGAEGGVATAGPGQPRGTRLTCHPALGGRRIQVQLSPNAACRASFDLGGWKM